MSTEGSYAGTETFRIITQIDGCKEGWHRVPVSTAVARRPVEPSEVQPLAVNATYASYVRSIPAEGQTSDAVLHAAPAPIDITSHGAAGTRVRCMVGLPTQDNYNTPCARRRRTCRTRCCRCSSSRPTLPSAAQACHLKVVSSCRSP